MQSQTVFLSESSEIKPNQRLRRTSVTRYLPGLGWYEVFDDGDGSATAITASLIDSVRNRDPQSTPVT